MISPKQIRAARAMLDWSQETLAEKAGIGLSTVRSIEKGSSQARGNTTSMILKAVITEGLEFTSGDGVRNSIQPVCVFEGLGAEISLIRDIFINLETTPSSVWIIMRSESLFSYIFADSLADIARLATNGRVHYLAATLPPYDDNLLPSVVAEARLPPVSCLTYAGNYVILVKDPLGHHRFVVMRIPALAMAYEDHFSKLIISQEKNSL